MLYRVLYWIAAAGYATRPDIALAMGIDMQILAARKSSLLAIARACKTLEEEALIDQTQAKLWYSTFTLLRLTQTGVAYCKEFFPWKVIPSDWNKLIQYHNGMRDINHAAAVLVFSYQARLRGWAVEVMPHEKVLNTKPDVQISKNQESLYVEVEMKASHAKGKIDKWRKQDELQGNVVLCMLSAQGAANIAHYLKEKPFPRFQIASLQRLLFTAYQESGPGQLWSYLSED